MIREVLGDCIALVVFTLGGALSALALLKINVRNNVGIKKHLLDAVLGILSGVVFILLTEVYFEGVIEVYTIISFIIGYTGVILFFSESTRVKKAPKPWKLKLKEKLASKIPIKKKPSR